MFYVDNSILHKKQAGILLVGIIKKLSFLQLYSDAYRGFGRQQKLDQKSIGRIPPEICNKQSFPDKQWFLDKIKVVGTMNEPWIG